MPSGLSKDRRELNNLHVVSNGTGSTAAESSSKISIEGSSSKWKLDPTPIPKPGENRPRNKFTTNPYSLNMSNNLSNSRGSHAVHATLVPLNRGSHATLSARSDKPPAPKKQRRETHVPMNGRSTIPQGPDRSAHSLSAVTVCEVDDIFSSPSRSSGRNSPKRKKPTQAKRVSSHPDHFTAVIDVDADADADEDIGERINLPASESSDDMLLHEGERPGQDFTESSVSGILGVDGPSHHHPFNLREQSALDALPPASGPSTSALKAIIGSIQNGNASADGFESDPIENFDDTAEERRSPEAIQRKRKATPSRTTDFPIGHVRDTVRQWNGHANTSQIPEIDLAARGKQRKKINSSMKPQKHSMVLQQLITSKHANPPTLERQTRKRQDAIATAPTNFRNVGKRRESWTDFRLPIEKWICGSRVEVWDDTRPLWFSLRDGHVLILSQSTDETAETLINLSKDDILGVECPRHSQNSANSHDNLDEYPYLGIHVRKTARVKEPFKGQKIHVKILKDANWDSLQYERIGDALSSQSYGMHHIDSHARRAQCEAMNREEATPKTTVVSTQTAKRLPRPRPSYAGARPEDAPGRSLYPSAQGVRRSSRNSASTSRNPSRQPSHSVDETILLYPATGTGAVNVTIGDLKRLEPGEYLNDTLIELGLKIWLSDLKDSNASLAEQVHVFSSFFYTQLNQKNIEEGYQSVRKWTSKFDLFQKRYIIIPINEHMHWYLAIICYPERALHRPRPTQPTMPNVTTRTKLRESVSKPGAYGILEPQGRSELSLSSLTPKSVAASSRSVTGDEHEVENIVSALPHTPARDNQDPPSSPLSTIASGSPKGEIIPETESEGDDEQKAPDMSMKVDSPSPDPPRDLGAVPASAFYATPSTTAHAVSVNTNEEDDRELVQPDSGSAMDVDDPPSFSETEKSDQPYIFSFDSLGARHPHALKLLARYLDIEARDKKGLLQTTPAIQKQASVPTQPNYCDCGVYLLHFVEQFMSDPEGFILRIADHTKSKKPSDVHRKEREALWNHAMVANKRENLTQRIETLSLEWKREKGADGKGEGGTESEADKAQTERIIIDNDSDIEVLEVTPEPTKATKGTRSRTPTIQKAQRLR